MENKTFIGVDPGFSGGIAILDDFNNLITYPMPKRDRRIFRKDDRPTIDPVQVAQRLQGIQDRHEIVCVLELVSSSPQMGVVSSFRFGQGFGAVQAVLENLGFIVMEIPSTVWKPSLGLSPDKQKSLALARKLFPQHEKLFKQLKNDGLAEAALLAHYGRLHFRNVKHSKPQKLDTLDDLI